MENKTLDMEKITAYAETHEGKALLAAVLHELRLLRKPEDSLWKVAQVADYLGLSVKTVHNLKASRKDFPKPVPGCGRARWQPDAIKKWATKAR